MKAPKEIRNWINKRRSADGKKNGVVRWLFESPRIERMFGADKKRKSLRNMTEADFNEAHGC